MSKGNGKVDRGKVLEERMNEIEALCACTFVIVAMTRATLEGEMRAWARRDRWVYRWLALLVFVCSAVLGLGFAAFISFPEYIR